MTFATAKNVISLWPPVALYGAAAGVLILGVRSGSRSIAGEVTEPSPND